MIKDIRTKNETDIDLHLIIYIRVAGSAGPTGLSVEVVPDVAPLCASTASGCNPTPFAKNEHKVFGRTYA